MELALNLYGATTMRQRQSIRRRLKFDCICAPRQHSQDDDDDDDMVDDRLTRLWDKQGGVTFPKANQPNKSTRTRSGFSLKGGIGHSLSNYRINH